MRDSKASKIMNRNLSLGILIVVGLALVFGGAAWCWNAHENRWGKITFQEYVPGYLPDELTVTSKTIDARHTPSNKPSHTTTLNLKLSENSYIYEQKDVMHFTYTCVGLIVNQTCSVRMSPHNQRYILTTSKVPGQPIEQTAKWLQGSTVMMATFRGESSQPYSDDTFGRIVDSLHMVTYENLDVNYYDNSRV